ncbi:unnamed protein product [Discosporangium mesarthrocarpum]
MNFQQEFILLLKAHYPIIYISTLEEDRVEYTVRKIILNGNIIRNLYIWDFIGGYQINTPVHKGFGKRNPIEALELIEKINFQTSSIFILKDFRRFLNDIAISRKLRNIIQILKMQPKTIIIVDSEVEIPTDLQDHITVIKFNLPHATEIRGEVEYLLTTIKSQEKLRARFMEKIIQSCQGLSLEKIRRVLGKSIAIYKKIDENCIDLILEEKRQIINQTQILEFWSVNEKLEDIGGVDNLKKWLQRRSNCFSEKAINYGLATPRGVLLIGVQGSGKSLISKALASEWKLPLLRLDVGKLFAGIIGESESRLRKMIQIVESLAPCILWVDEMDKAFKDSDHYADGGTSSRVLASFVTWLSEKTIPVFVIGTANNINSLPVEILRKGRFDEIFFIGLPNQEERKMIFEVHLKKMRPDTWYQYNTQILSRKSNNFSGAEIEQAIIEAMYNAFSENREFNTEDILLAIKQLIPLMEIDPERVELVQEWAYSGKIRIA